MRVHHISGSLFDHCLLWICFDNENVCFYKRDKPFRFEVMWMKDDWCEGVIKDAWDEQHWGNPINRLVTKVEACCTKLKTWNRHSFGHI